MIDSPDKNVKTKQEKEKRKSEFKVKKKHLLQSPML